MLFLLNNINLYASQEHVKWFYIIVKIVYTLNPTINFVIYIYIYIYIYSMKLLNSVTLFEGYTSVMDLQT